MEELLDCLAGSRYFTVTDMKSGYHQIEVSEQHKVRTVDPLEFDERMPFGLVNALATYQRLMEECLDELHLAICLAYLDDVIVFSKTYEEHLERLEQVFQRLQQCGLKLAPKKCSLMKNKVNYVGYIVSEDIKADKISKVVDWPTPVTPEDVRRIVRFAMYYRKFVNEFPRLPSH